VYVTLIERADSRRRPATVPAPRLAFAACDSARLRLAARGAEPRLHGALGELLAMTTIHVAAGPAAGPLPVAVVRVDGRRHLARLDPAAAADLPPEDALAGLRVRLALGPDHLPTFRPVTKGTFLFGHLSERAAFRNGRGTPLS
jgi:hypothetical protein